MLSLGVGRILKKSAVNSARLKGFKRFWYFYEICMTAAFRKGKIIISSPVSLKISALSKIKARGVDAHPVHLE
jgi:hypothetical protein